MKKILTFVVFVIVFAIIMIVFSINYVPEITKEQALKLVLQQEIMLNELYSQGFGADELEAAYAWYSDADNKACDVPDTHNSHNIVAQCHAVYCTPKFDTEKAFDTYFTKFFTENALEKMKTALAITEINGRLCGVPLKYESDNKYPEEMEIVSVIREYNLAFISVMMVTDKDLVTEYTDNVYKSMKDVMESDAVRVSRELHTYTFEYSKRYGWRSAYCIFDEDYKAVAIDKAYEDSLPVPEFYTTPAVVRPKGYDDPILSHDTALEILNEEKLAIANVLLWAGTAGKRLGEYYNYYAEWNSNIDNQALPAYHEEHAFNGAFRVYFVPWLDTMEEFDNYFLNFFTEETLQHTKKGCGIEEIDGRLAIVPRPRMAYGSPLIDYDLTTVKSIEYDEKSKTATVYLNVFDIEGNPLPGNYVETLVYSEQYGWRVHQESELVS